MLHASRTAHLVLASTLVALATTGGNARAQQAQGGFSTGPQGWQAGTQPAPYVPPPTSGSQPASDLELGTLYGLAAGYGVGTGIWIDAELGIDDPGLKFLAPAILGVGAPASLFLLNRPRMPRGLPASISAGMAVGAGEAVGITSYQFVHASAADAWGFRGFARSVFIGSTGGAVLGYVTGVAMEPSPKTSLLLGSSVAWGGVIGSMFGYGGSAAGSDFGAANDSASLGGLIGYNVGLVGAAAISTVWVPTYESLQWMWVGFGVGSAASLPVFLLYAGGDHDARRGLIFMGTAATLGLGAAALFTIDSREFGQSSGSGLFGGDGHAPIQITGGGLMPVRGGMGFQLSGLLF